MNQSNQLVTPITQLLEKDHPHINSLKDPTSQFAKLPDVPPAQEVVDSLQQQPVDVANNPAQGLSKPTINSKFKEFFGLKENDYKLIILVFAILLIFCSGSFQSTLRPYVPGTIGPDGKTTFLGSLLLAILGTLIFVVVKIILNF
jgi:hypothetical protein